MGCVVIPPDLLTQAVTIVHAGSTTDRYGNTVPDWDAATRTTVMAWVQQTTGSEVTEQRNAQIGDWLMICDPAAVTGADRVEWAGLVFEVLGPPAPVPTPQGIHHTEVRLRTVDG